MRPITPGLDYVTGAYTPRTFYKLVDTAAREKTYETKVPSNFSPTSRDSFLKLTGLGVAYGTFIDLWHNKYGVGRFFDTKPVAALSLYAQHPTASDQVNNPMTNVLLPGYTSSLQMGNSPLAAIVTKSYLGAPVQ
jgi:hypothetical protein